MTDDNFKETNRGSELVSNDLSPAYVKFTDTNRKLWIVINLGLIIANGFMATMSWRLLHRYPNECAGLKMASYAFWFFYISNTAFSSLALVGLEKKLCSTAGIGVFIVMDLVILTYAQYTFFKSQKTNCL